MLAQAQNILKLFVETLKVEVPLGDKRACGSLCLFTVLHSVKVAPLLIHTAICMCVQGVQLCPSIIYYVG